MDDGVDDGASARSASTKRTVQKEVVEGKSGGASQEGKKTQADVTAGTMARGVVFYDTECGQVVLSGCRDLLNVQRWCECTGEHDQKREMRRILDNARQSSAASLSSHSAAAAEEERKCAADLEMVAGWNVDQLKQYLDEFNRKISGKLSILRSRVVETRKNGRLLEKYCNTPLRAMLDDAIVAWRHRREHE